MSRSSARPAGFVLHFLVINAVRYALMEAYRRPDCHEYMGVGTVADTVRQVLELWPDLDVNTRTIIWHDVNRHIGFRAPVGVVPDEGRDLREWRLLLSSVIRPSPVNSLMEKVLSIVPPVSLDASYVPNTGFDRNVSVADAILEDRSANKWTMAQIRATLAERERLGL